MPAIVDLAAMRDALADLGADPARVDPHVPVELIIDHSVIAEVAGRADAAALCRAIDAEPDTLAIVGTRGLGGITGMRLGRIPIQLVHHTGAAVVMVPQSPVIVDAADSGTGQATRSS